MTRSPIVFGVVFLAGCGSAEDGARTIFSQSYTCPIERVEARVRKDLKPSSFRNAGPATPPPDIAADPGRLQMWQGERAKAAAKEDGNWTIVEVRGCDKDLFYECIVPPKNNGGPHFACVPETPDVPNSISKWSN